MPKRKRISFTTKKRRVSSTPARAVSQSTQQSSQKRRGRPPAKKQAVAVAVAKDLPASEDDQAGDTDLDEPSPDVERGDAQGSAAEEDEDEGGSEDEDEDEDGDEDGRDRAARAPIAEDATVAYVPVSTIEKKWAPLDAAGQEAVRRLLAASARPVVAAHLDRHAAKGDGRGAEAQEAVARVTRVFERKLPRMAFPPTKGSTSTGTGGSTAAAAAAADEGAEGFDYEALLRRNRTLQGQAVAQTADVVALEKELAGLGERIAGLKAEEETAKTEYERERDALTERHEGPFGALLGKPEVEPEDSARRIKLVPWKRHKMESSYTKVLTHADGNMKSWVERRVDGSEVLKEQKILKDGKWVKYDASSFSSSSAISAVQNLVSSTTEPSRITAG